MLFYLLSHMLNPGIHILRIHSFYIGGSFVPGENFDVGQHVEVLLLSSKKLYIERL